MSSLFFVKSVHAFGANPLVLPVCLNAILDAGNTASTEDIALLVVVLHTTDKTCMSGEVKPSRIARVVADES